MGIINKIIDKNLKEKKNGKEIHKAPLLGYELAGIFNTKMDFCKIKSKSYNPEKIVNKFMECLNKEVIIDKPTKYKNVKGKYATTDLNEFKCPGFCLEDNQKNTFSATKKMSKTKEIYYDTNPENVME